jgi:hypothetical protein
MWKKPLPCKHNTSRHKSIAQPKTDTINIKNPHIKIDLCQRKTEVSQKCLSALELKKHVIWLLNL